LKELHPDPGNIVKLITEDFQGDFSGLDTSSFQSYLVVAGRRGANVVHFVPTQRDLRVRFRVGTELRDVGFIAHPAGERKPHPLTVQFRAAAGLTPVGRGPGMGRFSLEVEGRLLSFRVSTIPQVFGDRVVVRIFDLSLLRDFSLLGYRPETARKVSGLLERRSGLVLVAGPSGSGRTTTLYSLLTALNQGNRDITTVEDPVECYVPGINQVQVDPATMDLAAALRAVMRLDPEIVMVGELVDPQTADLAMRMALNGVQVLASITSSTCVGALLRMVEFGIPPSRLRQGLAGVTSQVLLRRLCSECARPVRTAPLDQVTTFDPVGCPACRGVGFQGLQGVQEVLEIGDRIKRRLSTDLDEEDLGFLALSSGMETLKEDAVYKAVSGAVCLADAVEVSDEPIDRIASLIERALRQLRGETEEAAPAEGGHRPPGLLSTFRSRRGAQVLQPGSVAEVPPGEAEPSGEDAGIAHSGTPQVLA